MSQNFRFGKRSRARLAGVHPDLCAVTFLAISISNVDMSILEGGRTEQRQQVLIDSGRSWTSNSRHLLKVPKYKEIEIPQSHAVDIGAYIDGRVVWEWPPYYEIYDAMKKASEQLGIPIEWGGHWRGKHKDGPHYQLPWRSYPIETG